MSARASRASNGPDRSLEVVEREPRRQVVAPAPLPAAESEAPTLRAYVDTILGSWPLVAAVTAASLLAGACYYLVATPIYQTDALVQIEEKSKGLAGIEDLSAMFATQSPADTEIELLRSRSLLGAVVDELRLDLSAEPRRFPVVGGAVARRHEGLEPAAAPLGLTRYAWGGERIDLARLDVPQRWLGKRLTLVAGEGGRYEVLGPDGALTARGAVGEASVAAVQGAEAPHLFVRELVARPGTEFRLRRDARVKAVESLQRKLSVGEKGRKTGVIRLALEGPDPLRLAAILDGIEKAYLRQNVARKSAEAEKTLEFIATQLPDLKRDVELAETALNDYRTKRGSVDVSLETKAALDRAVEIEKELTGLKLQRDEAKVRFTEDHPAMKVLREKVDRLQGERADVEARFKRLPRAELESARRLRDVKVSNELYVLLLNKSQELKVLKSGTIGNVRIVDAPVLAIDPVAPRAGTTLALAGLLGLMLGVAAAFVRRSLDQGVDDPEQLEREMGIPVYASVPHSEAQSRASGAGRGVRKGVAVLAAASPNDLAVEAVRSLRTSLQFALAEAPNNVVALGGPSPGIGKSFVSVNLAHVVAESGRRVLLVDADLRKGRLHHYFGGERGTGLADVIASEVDPAVAVREVTAGLSFLSMGTLPANPSELLASRRYEEVIAWAARSYDVVVIDTAPILAVTDAALAARPAGIHLLVLRAGQHPMREVGAAVKRMAQNGVEPHAIILNDVKPKAPGYSYSRYGYHYHYEYKR